MGGNILASVILSGGMIYSSRLIARAIVSSRVATSPRDVHENIYQKEMEIYDKELLKTHSFLRWIDGGCHYEQPHQKDTN